MIEVNNFQSSVDDGWTQLEGTIQVAFPKKSTIVLVEYQALVYDDKGCLLYVSRPREEIVRQDDCEIAWFESLYLSGADVSRVVLKAKMYSPIECIKFALPKVQEKDGRKLVGLQQDSRGKNGQLESLFVSADQFSVTASLVVSSLGEGQFAWAARLCSSDDEGRAVGRVSRAQFDGDEVLIDLSEPSQENQLEIYFMNDGDESEYELKLA